MKISVFSRKKAEYIKLYLLFDFQLFIRKALIKNFHFLFEQNNLNKINKKKHYPKLLNRSPFLGVK